MWANLAFEHSSYVKQFSSVCSLEIVFWSCRIRLFVTCIKFLSNAKIIFFSNQQFNRTQRNDKFVKKNRFILISYNKNWYLCTGFWCLIWSSLKGNSVKYRSCPRNCNLVLKLIRTVIYHLHCHCTPRRTRRPVNSRKPGDLPILVKFKAFGWKAEMKRKCFRTIIINSSSISIWRLHVLLSLFNSLNFIPRMTLN